MDACKRCGAAGHGNATCYDCVDTWPTSSIKYRLLSLLVGREPSPPVGAAEVERFAAKLSDEVVG